MQILKLLLKIYNKTIGRFFISAQLFSIELVPSNARKLPKKYQFVIIKESDLQRYDLILKERKKGYEKEVESYMDDKDMYGLAVLDTETNKIVYSCWIKNSNQYDKALRKHIQLKDDECYFLEANCARNFRGEGLHTYMIQERINFAYNQGKKKAYISMYGFNTPALSVGKHFNYKKVKSVIYYRTNSISLFFKNIFRKIISSEDL